MNIKNIGLLVGLFGLLLLVVGITQIYYRCPPNETIYRYIPRSFNEEQNNPVPLMDIFGSMFFDQSPWMGSFNIYYKPKTLTEAQWSYADTRDYLTAIPPGVQVTVNNP